MELTEEEVLEWDKVKEKEIVIKNDRYPIRKNIFRDYPKAARHYIHLFPNHYLDIIELEEKDTLKNQVAVFLNLLNSTEVTERKILNHINQNDAYFIIGAILKAFHFRVGHHEAYLFPEFQLGNSYKVDYLLVGKGSGGFEFVFIELEAPIGNITLANGELGSSFRKGLGQIDDWSAWLEAQYYSLKETFNKYKKNGETLPEEFLTMDKSRIHFAVVAGRRKDFKDKTYRIKRSKFSKEGCLLLHYDNLVDAAGYIIGQNTY
jgi:hypothetical protein